MSFIRDLNPFCCRMWDLHDRLDAHIDEASCRAEIESFLKHGQLVPVLGRPLKNDPKAEFELIYGARRLFIARHLNMPLRAEVREISDREAIVAMDIENRHRKDISAYERGLSYARWLRETHFSSQEEIASHLRISPSQVSRLLRVARLPSVVVSAFASATEICESWGLTLADALDDPVRRRAVIHKARTIAMTDKRPAACEVYRALLSAASPGRKVVPLRHDEVVSDANRTVLFRIRFQRSSIALVVPANKVPAKSLEKMRQALAAILQGAPLKEHTEPARVPVQQLEPAAGNDACASP